MGSSRRSNLQRNTCGSPPPTPLVLREVSWVSSSCDREEIILIQTTLRREVAEDADRSMAAYREIAHRADAATRDWHSAIQGYNTSVGAICGYREKFLVRCTEEFGDAPEVVLPIDEGSDDVGREP